MAKKQKTPAPSSNDESSSITGPRRPARGRASTTPLPPTGAPVAPDAAPRAVANDTANPVTWPSHGEIAEVAYRRFLDRGGNHGSDVDDWVEAERDLLRRSR